MNRVDLALRLEDHQAVCGFHYGVGIFDVLFNLGCVVDIRVYGIIARCPLRRVAVCGWLRCWWLLCWRRWCLWRSELCDIAVKLKIDHLVVEIAVIATKVVPLA